MPTSILSSSRPTEDIAYDENISTTALLQGTLKILTVKTEAPRYLEPLPSSSQNSISPVFPSCIYCNFTHVN